MRAHGRLAIISRPGRKGLRLEIPCGSRNDSQKLVEEFGGKTEKLSRDWLKRFTDGEQSKPLKIGKRLLISAKSDSQTTLAAGKPPLLVIPRGTAFGTGEHPTTAMSLRLLEQLTREWKNGWSLADLGTGSGILALAAKRFGAHRVLAIDIDPIAISTAKANARQNGIDGVDFQLRDVRRWAARRIDIVTSNLFGELLIRILPKLNRSRWLILSGVLRAEEKEFLRALHRRKIDLVEVRRRGKWIAVLANGSAHARRANPARRKPEVTPL